MEKMEYHRYSCVPIIDKDGRYKGCITEGDILWGINKLHIADIKDAEKIPVMKVDRKYNYKPIRIETDMEQLISRAMNQNFVPVVDDGGKFIGIITRKDIMQYFYKKLSLEQQIG
jgi:CBS domain-containing protein